MFSSCLPAPIFGLALPITFAILASAVVYLHRMADRCSCHEANPQASPRCDTSGSISPCVVSFPATSGRGAWAILCSVYQGLHTWCCAGLSRRSACRTVREGLGPAQSAPSSTPPRTAAASCVTLAPQGAPARCTAFYPRRKPGSCDLPGQKLSWQKLATSSQHPFAEGYHTWRDDLCFHSTHLCELCIALSLVSDVCLMEVELPDLTLTPASAKYLPDSRSGLHGRL